MSHMALWYMRKLIQFWVGGTQTVKISYHHFLGLD